MFEAAALTALRTSLKDMFATAKYTAGGADYDASALTAVLTAQEKVQVSVTVSTQYGTISAIKLYSSAPALLVTQQVSIEAGASDSVVYRFTLELNEQQEE